MLVWSRHISVLGEMGACPTGCDWILEMNDLRRDLFGFANSGASAHNQLVSLCLHLWRGMKSMGDVPQEAVCLMVTKETQTEKGPGTNLAF